MRIGVDSGGTFTDVVALARDGTLRALKLPSTRGDPALAVQAGVLAAADGAQPTEVVHSTTVGTNALLERRGGPAALVITAGFEDLLRIRRQARPSLYALHPEVPPPLIDDAACFGVPERLDATGKVLRTPSEAELAALVEKVRGSGARAVAVCLLHSYVNPEPERRVAAALAPLGVKVVLSSDVLRAPREYERASTTAVDAYLMPVVAPYLERLAKELGCRVRVMESDAGAVAEARHPVRTVLSGPAAGVVGALAVARAAGFEDVITFDMGGTSTDVALVVGGRAGETDEAEVAGCAIQLPMVAVHTVGAGGGSIAWRDAGGALKVGPRSAGADPGPAAYGRGGIEPTVTDADLVLGRLDPDAPLKGVRLDVEQARAALTELARAIGRGVEEAAEDIVAVADAVMARAIKAVTVERGEDPAAFVLLSFGGAGGLHACGVARELEIAKVLVPPAPGLLCAWGALAADVVYELRRTLHADLSRTSAGALPAEALAGELATLETEAERALDAEGVPTARRVFERSCALRYRGQSFELLVPAEGDLVAAFHAAHRERYGYALAEPVELVAVRVRAIGRAEPLPPLGSLFAGEAGRVGEGPASQPVRYLGRVVDAAVRRRATLRPGDRLGGPAVITEPSGTTFVPPDAVAEVLPGYELLITLS